MNEYVADLPRDERHAFLGWFAGGSSEVIKYDNSKDVFWGKSECEEVPFADFWLGKMLRLGWFDVKIISSGIAKGAIGAPRFCVYKFSPTILGIAAREKYFEDSEKKSEEKDEEMEDE